jgi:hypothetical protein
MFADLVTELEGIATAAAGIGAAIVGVLAVGMAIGWVKRLGSKAG